MYRYGQPSRPSRSKYQQTFLLLLILGLTIACIYLAVSSSGATRANANTHKALVSQIQTEVSQAKTRAGQLLPTGGSKTESMVAAVRQHIWTARIINKMAIDIYGAGNELVNELLITNCVGYLNECDRKIQTGQVVTDTYNQLSDAIDILYEQVSMLE